MPKRTLFFALICFCISYALGQDGQWLQFPHAGRASDLIPGMGEARLITFANDLIIADPTTPDRDRLTPHSKEPKQTIVFAIADEKGDYWLSSSTHLYHMQETGYDSFPFPGLHYPKKMISLGNGRFYANMGYEGIALFDNGQWTFWNPDNSAIQTPVFDFALHPIDSSIWMQTPGGMMMLNNGIVTQMYNFPSTTGQAFDMAFDPQGILWMVNYEHIGKYDGQVYSKWIIASNPQLNCSQFSSIEIDEQGNAWLPKRSSAQNNCTWTGFIKIVNNQIISVEEDSDGDPLPTLRQVKKGPDGKLWARYYGNEDQTSSYVLDGQEWHKAGTSLDSIQSWMGSPALVNGKDFYLLNENTLGKFQGIVDIQSYPLAIQANFSHTAQDPEGNLYRQYFTNNNSELSLFEKVSSEGEQFLFSHNAYVLSFAAVSPTDIWFVSLDPTANSTRYNLNHWDGQDIQIYSLPVGSEFVQNFANLLVRGPKDIWLSGGRSIVHFDGNEFKLISPPFPASQQGLALDKEGKVWAISSLYTGRWTGTTWTLYFDNIGFSKITSSPNGTIWVLAFDGTLRHFDGEHFVQHVPPYPAFSSIFFAVNEEETVFLSSYNGLHFYFSEGINKATKPKAPLEPYYAWTLYPNPSQGQLYLDHSQACPAGTLIEVLDLSGRLVHKEMLPPSDAQGTRKLNLEALQAGIYIFRIHTDAGPVHKKIKIERF